MVIGSCILRILNKGGLPLIVRQSDGLRLSLAIERQTQLRAVHELSASGIILMRSWARLMRTISNKTLLTSYGQARSRIQFVHTLVLLLTDMNWNAAPSDHFVFIYLAVVTTLW